jgi:hypothetical protein
MSASTANSAVSERLSTALTDSIPALVTGILLLVLRTKNAEQIAQVAAGVVVILCAGLPALRRSTNADCRRAAPARIVTPPVIGTYRRVVPSTTTLVLAVLLGGAAFWLLDLLTTWLGLGSLGYWSGDYPDEPSAVYRAVALRSLPVLLPGVFVLGVAIAHRLHDRAKPALTAVCVIYAAAVLTSNLVLARHWGSETLPEDMYFPFLFGAAAWLVCRVAVWQAARTQEFFDVMQAVRVQLRRRAEEPGDRTATPAGTD